MSKIKLTENKLRNIIKESVYRILNENEEDKKFNVNIFVYADFTNSYGKVRDDKAKYTFVTDKKHLDIKELALEAFMKYFTKVQDTFWGDMKHKPILKYYRNFRDIEYYNKDNDEIMHVVLFIRQEGQKGVSYEHRGVIQYGHYNKYGYFTTDSCAPDRSIYKKKK